VEEQLFEQAGTGRLIRPFQEAAGICCRGYSGPLQRAVTDFGADVAFGRISEKVREHYGIEVPASTAQAITEKHAAQFLAQEQLESQWPEKTGVKELIVETDGSMIPTVNTGAAGEGEAPSDRRKKRQLGRGKKGSDLFLLYPRFIFCLADADFMGRLAQRRKDSPLTAAEPAGRSLACHFPGNERKEIFAWEEALEKFACRTQTGGAGNVGEWAGLLKRGLRLTLFGRVPHAGSPAAKARPSR
jgi:hypothetical protein